MATLIGSVVSESSGAALASGTLEVDGETSRRVIGERLTLALDTGEQVTLDVSPAELVVSPRTEREAAWREVATTRLAALFSDKAPGDHVDVKLVGWVIDPGARVAVWRDDATGRARAIAIVDGDDAAAIDAVERARAAQPARPAATDAAALARARPPVDHRQPKPARAPKPWRIAPWVLLALGTALAGVTLVAEPSPARGGAGALSIPLAFGALLATLALVMWLSRPPFEADESRLRRRWVHPSWGVAHLAFWLAFVGAMLIAVTGLLAPPIAFAYVAVVGVAGVTWCGLYHRLQLRVARLLLLSRGRLDGVVEADGLVIGRDVSYVQKSSSYTSTVRAADGGTATRTSTTYWTEARGSSSPLARFRIRCGDEVVEVTGDRATWGAPIEYRPVKKQGIRFATTARIRGGDRVVVLARVDRTDGAPTIRATGREALVMFGAPDRPLATLRRLTLAWLANAALVVAIAAASAGYAIALAVRDAPAPAPAPAPYTGPAERPPTGPIGPP